MQEQGSEAGWKLSLGYRFLLAFYEEVELEEFLERYMKQIDNELSNISKN